MLVALGQGLVGGRGECARINIRGQPPPKKKTKVHNTQSSAMVFLGLASISPCQVNEEGED